MVYYFAENEDGRIMAIDSEGNMMTLPVSPALEAQAPPPPAPIPEAPAPAAAGGDPGDSGDDSDDEKEDDDDDSHGNNNNANDNQDNGAVARELCCVRTSTNETNYFSMPL